MYFLFTEDSDRRVAGANSAAYELLVAVLVASACQMPTGPTVNRENVNTTPVHAASEEAREAEPVASLVPTAAPSEMVLPPASAAECERLTREARTYLNGEARRCERDTDCVLHDVQCPIGGCSEAVNVAAVARSDSAVSGQHQRCGYCCTKCLRGRKDVAQCHDGRCTWQRQ
jgi:hypothetical protein